MLKTPPPKLVLLRSRDHYKSHKGVIVRKSPRTLPLINASPCLPGLAHNADLLSTPKC